ncbi:stage II sporulation protein P, partial [Micrococcus sp. SIMBA_144]
LNPEYRITSNSLNQAASNVKGEVLYKILAMENRSFNQVFPEEERALPGLSSILFQGATNVSFEDPRSFLGRELPGFSIFDGDIMVAGEGTDFTNMPIASVPTPEALEQGNEAPLKNVSDLKETNQQSG